MTVVNECKFDYCIECNNDLVGFVIVKNHSSRAHSYFSKFRLPCEDEVYWVLVLHGVVQYFVSLNVILLLIIDLPPSALK